MKSQSRNALHVVVTPATTITAKSLAHATRPFAKGGRVWMVKTSRTSKRMGCTIQTKIGQQLRAQYELPQELPHGIVALLMQLNAEQDGSGKSGVS